MASGRNHKQRLPQAGSWLARRTLDEEGQTEVRLIDLGHDYIIRRLREHDRPYVAYITGMEIRRPQMHFGKYMEKQTEKPPCNRRESH